MLPEGSGHERTDAPRVGKYLFVSAPFSIVIAPHHDDTLWVVAECLCVTPHVAAKAKHSDIDRRTMRHAAFVWNAVECRLQGPPPPSFLGR